MIGGLLLTSPSSSQGVLILASLVLAWWMVAVFMKTPQRVASRVVSLKDMKEEAVDLFLKQASMIKGVKEVSVYTEDRVAYLKVEKPFDEQALKALLSS